MRRPVGPSFPFDGVFRGEAPRAMPRPIARSLWARARTFTTDRQTLRGEPATIGRLVADLDALLAAQPDLATALCLKPV
jgi:hypothetical protein